MTTGWRVLGGRVLGRHATIAAYLALALASSAAAYAANTVGSADIIDESILSVDLKDGQAVSGSDVVADSLTGAQIDEQTLNAGQFKGADAGVFTGRSTVKLNTADNNLFLAPDGPSAPVAVNDSAVRLISPASALQGRDLMVTEAQQKSTDGTRTYIVRVNGVDSLLRCQISGAATKCSNTNSSVMIPAGAALSLHLARGSGGTRTASLVHFAWRVVSP